MIELMAPSGQGVHRHAFPSLRIAIGTDGHAANLPVVRRRVDEMQDRVMDSINERLENAR
jgi:hypothetical protein